MSTDASSATLDGWLAPVCLMDQITKAPDSSTVPLSLHNSSKGKYHAIWEQGVVATRTVYGAKIRLHPRNYSESLQYMLGVRDQKFHGTEADYVRTPLTHFLHNVLNDAAHSQRHHPETFGALQYFHMDCTETERGGTGNPHHHHQWDLFLHKNVS